ncbi:hypothetical protein F511_07989 [Dorcoceras hygrometricum]|uniref:Dystroglycan-like n=1 Tax=Dorcoceras hygrometricum TaxID=472368 RepID=A0A2Z7BA43_9LAMI|nr:hypothetical protein F511_07989 [Dorcoceras hygrometricum]
MASSFISNTVHVLFDSVLAMDDEGIVAIFEALVASGLKGFLGCPAVIYEDALIEFFQHGFVRDGMLVSTIQGKTVEITEEVFAGTFELPTDGLTDLNEVIKDLVFYARCIFSFTGEQVSTSCKKREMKIEFRLLSDILAKSIFVKAGSFNAVTHERFLMMAAINGGVNINWSRVLFNIFKDMVRPGSKQARGYAVQICCLLKKIQDLKLGDFKAFPPLKILTEKTVNRYTAINDKISVEDVEGVADESRVKKTPMKKAMSKNRPATAVDEHISKKKRTRVGKAAKSSEIVKVAQEAIPLQIDRMKKLLKKRRAVGGIAEKDSVSARAYVVDKEISTVDDVDHIIEQIIAETAQFETDIGGTNVGETNVGDQADQRADEMEHWFNVSYEEFVAREAGRMVESDSDTDEEIVADKVTRTDVGIQMETGPDAYFVEEPSEETELSQGTEIATAVPTTDEKISDDESMTLEEILSTIPGNLSLPSSTWEVTKIQFGKSITIRGVNEGDWYKTSLPKIPAAAKGKAPLQERDPIKGNPAKEIFLLICADIEILVQIREHVIDEVEQFFNYFSFKKMAALKIEDIYAKEEQTPVHRRIRLYKWILINIQILHLPQLILPCTSMQMIFLRKKTQLMTSLSFANQTGDSRKSGDAHGEVMSKINHVERVLLDSLAAQNQAFRGLIKSTRQEAHNDNDVLLIALKAVRAQNAILTTDLADVRQEVKDLKAEFSKDFDDKLAVIHNDLLEFRVETQGQLASLGTNLAELIAFITKRSDDKKGEVSSSHGRGQPPPDDQSRPSGGSASRGGGDGSSRRRDDRRVLRQKGDPVVVVVDLIKRMLNGGYMERISSRILSVLLVQIFCTVFS